MTKILWHYWRQCNELTSLLPNVSNSQTIQGCNVTRTRHPRNHGAILYQMRYCKVKFRDADFNPVKGMEKFKKKNHLRRLRMRLSSYLIIFFYRGRKMTSFSFLWSEVTMRTRLVFCRRRIVFVWQFHEHVVACISLVIKLNWSISHQSGRCVELFLILQQIVGWPVTYCHFCGLLIKKIRFLVPWPSSRAENLFISVHTPPRNITVRAAWCNALCFCFVLFFSLRGGFIEGSSW